MEKERTTQERLEAVSRKILAASRNELYLGMRFFDVALSSFRFVMDPEVFRMGSDGLALYYDPKYLGGAYREDRVKVNRLYLHQVLHGIFKHMVRRDKREARIYHLACDIVAESVIDSMQHRCVLRSRSLLRRETYRKLEQEMKVLTAEKVYGYLERLDMDGREFSELEAEFREDDHSRWPEDEDKEKRNEVENRWQDISEKMETEMETFSSEMQGAAGHLIGQLSVENRERYDYQEFLRKFSVLKEETTVDEDSFDYAFYSYGLSLYGNMPLIEPQEWKETLKVEEFVIVIDTSMSCSGDLVKKFLEETYDVLSENDSFFRKVHIHIIQCDDQVQSDQIIKDGNELKEYMEGLELVGEGGTDFRPAFDYVGKLLDQRVFSRLKGLLYFTDGRGTYPSKMPPYQTAFVFLEEDYEDVDVPPWAIKLILEKEKIHEYKKG